MASSFTNYRPVGLRSTCWGFKNRASGVVIPIRFETTISNDPSSLYYRCFVIIDGRSKLVASSPKWDSRDFFCQANPGMDLGSFSCKAYVSSEEDPVIDVRLTASWTVNSQFCYGSILPCNHVSLNTTMAFSEASGRKFSSRDQTCCHVSPLSTRMFAGNIVLSSISWMHISSYGPRGKERSNETCSAWGFWRFFQLGVQLRPDADVKQNSKVVMKRTEENVKRGRRQTWSRTLK